MQTSQSISFLAEIFAIGFRSQGFSSQNYIFLVLLNFFSDPRKLFPFSEKLFLLSIEKFMNWTPAFRITVLEEINGNKGTLRRNR